MEIWKEIIGFDGKYLISNSGRIKSCKRKIGKGVGYIKDEKILKQNYDKDGYPMVSITLIKRKNITLKIHKLVAIHFLGSKPNEDSYVCHKDDNRLNNNVINLYWGNNKSNVLDRYKNGSTKFTISEIQNIKFLFNNGTSQKELMKKFNCNSSYMSRLVNNKRNFYIN